MKIVCFNVNSIRPRMHQIEAVHEKYAPDIIGLQETKVPDEQFPQAALRELGYHSVYHGQKTHFGVALLSREPLENVQRGFIGEDPAAQRRFIAGTCRVAGQPPVTVANGYFPQGENRKHPEKFPNKEHFYAGVLAWLESRSNDEHLILMGDFNVAPQDIDIGISAASHKRWLRDGHTSFLPEEREWFGQLMDWGLHDSFRSAEPDSTLMSWFDYRTRGFERTPKSGLRIDHILASAPMHATLKGAGIDHEIRGMEKPSDHCPIWAEYGVG